MARLTVEDCLGNIENRFELVLEASQRARKLSLGADPFVEWNNDKSTVVALREIAAGQLHISGENNISRLLKQKDQPPATEANKAAAEAMKLFEQEPAEIETTDQDSNPNEANSSDGNTDETE